MLALARSIVAIAAAAISTGCCSAPADRASGAPDEPEVAEVARLDVFPDPGEGGSSVHEIRDRIADLPGTGAVVWDHERGRFIVLLDDQADLLAITRAARDLPASRLELWAGGYLHGLDDHTSPPALAIPREGEDLGVRFHVEGWRYALRVTWWPVDQGSLGLHARVELRDGEVILEPIDWET